MKESDNKHILSVREAFHIGARAAKSNMLPAFILQAAAVSLLVAYRCSPSFRGVLDVVAELQKQYGIIFAMLVRTFFSGLIPIVFQIVIPSLRPVKIWRALWFSLFWWSFQGVLVYLFYGFQAIMFGSGTGWQSVVPKVLFDMLIYTTLIGCPSNSIAHIWLDMDCSWKGLKSVMGHGWYNRIVLPNLIPAWALWIPGVAVVYSLPDALQVHMASLIGCFWALLCLKIATYTKR